MAKTTPLNQVATTFSSKNISSALSVYQYTVTTTGFHNISVAATVAGNGNYSIYLTRQWLGSGNVYTMQPITTAAVASGNTYVEFQTIRIYLIASDVVQIMMLGLAGDTSVGGNVSIALDNFSVFDPAADTVATVTTLTNAPSNSSGITTILADYARRTGDYATVAALAILQGNVTTILADYARRTGDYATVTALATLQGNVTTILADYARRTGDYSTLAAGAAMTLTSAYDAAKIAAPLASANADAVWDEVLSGHVGAGSAGIALLTAGSAADPLLNAVPGTYPTGSAGAALGHISTSPISITISSPVATSGVITIYGGDDYYAVDGRSIDITDSSGVWPTLTGATVTFTAGGISKAMTVVTPTGTTKTVRLELSKAESLSLLMSGVKSPYTYKITAALVTSAHIVTLVESTLIVLA